MERQDRVTIVEKAKSVVQIRELIRTGSDEEGNRPSPQVPEFRYSFIVSRLDTRYASKTEFQRFVGNNLSW